jgi:hypothetical protein
MSDCKECGHEMCPCEDCHGEGGFVMDGWSYSSDTHYNYTVPCYRCAEEDERGRADDLNQLRAEDEMERVALDHSLRQDSEADANDAGRRG